MTQQEQWGQLPDDQKLKIRQLYERKAWKPIKIILEEYGVMSFGKCGTCQASEKRMRVLTWVKYAIHENLI